MFSFSGYYPHESRSSPVLVSSINGEDSMASSSSNSGKKSKAEASRIHKEAERRRRQRINAHLSTLRTLLPSTTKTDKASLLAEVVHHVRKLKRRVADVAAHRDGSLPGETDEATVENGTRYMRATVCCEDRASLNHDLSMAVGSVRARLVRSEITTVGGRTKRVLVMDWTNRGDDEIQHLKRALDGILDNRAGFNGLGLPVRDLKRARDNDAYFRPKQLEPTGYTRQTK